MFYKVSLLREKTVRPDFAEVTEDARTQGTLKSDQGLGGRAQGHHDPQRKCPGEQGGKAARSRVEKGYEVCMSFD